MNHEELKKEHEHAPTPPFDDISFKGIAVVRHVDGKKIVTDVRNEEEALQLGISPETASSLFLGVTGECIIYYSWWYGWYCESIKCTGTCYVMIKHLWPGGEHWHTPQPFEPHGDFAVKCACM